MTRPAFLLADATLNEQLAALGLHTRAHEYGKKSIRDAQDRVLFRGTAHEVWDWLEIGMPEWEATQ